MTIRLLAVDMDTGKVLRPDGSDSGWVVVPVGAIAEMKRVALVAEDAFWPTEEHTVGCTREVWDAMLPARPPVPADLAMRPIYSMDAECLLRDAVPVYAAPERKL